MTTPHRPGHAEFCEALLAAREPLQVPPGVELQVLSVERREGVGEANWLNHWRYVLVFR